MGIFYTHSGSCLVNTAEAQTNTSSPCTDFLHVSSSCTAKTLSFSAHHSVPLFNSQTLPLFSDYLCEKMAVNLKILKWKFFEVSETYKEESHSAMLLCY